MHKHHAAKTRLPMKLSSQWLKEMPANAKALIVAECFVKEHTSPSRRVALDWLYGDRNDDKPLRDAARKLPETLALADGGKEVLRQESDGVRSLSCSERCQTRWTVGSIAREFIICWSGFEDAINPPEPQAPVAPKLVKLIQSTGTPLKPTVEQQAAPAPTPTPAGPIADAKQPEQPLNARKTVDPLPAYPSPLPMFAPLDALIANRKLGFPGNCAAPECKFITDGRTLLLRSACDPKFLEKLKAADCGPYGPKNPVPQSNLQKLFDGAVPDARYEAKGHGFVLGASAGLTDDPNVPLVCLTGPGEHVAIVDGHRLRFVQSVTGADYIKRGNAKDCAKVVLFKGVQAVAVIVAIDMAEVRTLFKQMLQAEHNRSRMPHLNAADVRQRIAS